MKESVDAAAYNYAIHKTDFRKDVLKEVDEDDYDFRLSDCRNDFKVGAQWQAKQSQWISVDDELPPYNKEVLLFNNRNKTIGCQIFNDGYNIKTYCDWYCISYWMLANFPE